MYSDCVMLSCSLIPCLLCQLIFTLFITYLSHHNNLHCHLLCQVYCLYLSEYTVYSHRKELDRCRIVMGNIFFRNIMKGFDWSNKITNWSAWMPYFWEVSKLWQLKLSLLQHGKWMLIQSFVQYQCILLTYVGDHPPTRISITDLHFTIGNFFFIQKQSNWKFGIKCFYYK